MNVEISNPGESFLERFQERCKDWLEDPNTKDEEDSTVDSLCPGVLKKRQDLKETAGEEARVVTDSSPPENKIHGFTNEILYLKNLLLDQKVYHEFKTLVVAGEYGVGKTSLSKIIFNDKDIKSVYVPRIWVSLHSNDARNKKISVLKRILKDLGVEDEMFKTIHNQAGEEAEMNQETVEANEISALFYALHLNLRRKKYLIVFDDVREEDEWDEKTDEKDKRWGKYIADGFPKGSGGRVIYTTRDESKALAKKLVSEEHQIHRLWPLSDVETVWQIYTEALAENGQEEIPRDDMKCKEDMMDKSRGLPLAIRMLATLRPLFPKTKKTDAEKDSTKETTDTESAEEKGSTKETTDSTNNPYSEESTTTKPLQDRED